ncbi:MAG: hypothetical protein R3C11_19345 [Planctomycetaceae bacterium]
MSKTTSTLHFNDGKPSIWREETQILCLAAERPAWVNLTLQLDNRGCHSPRLETVSTESELLNLVHEHEYDVLIFAFRRLTNFEAEVGNLLRSIRLSGNSDPVLLLVEQMPAQTLASCYEADIEFLHTSLFWDSPALVFALERARLRHRMQEEHLAWGRERKQKLIQEKKESERILEQQRNMLSDLKSLARSDILADELTDPSFSRQLEVHPSQSRALSGTSTIVTELTRYYAALLKSYVVMGTGSLNEEIKEVAFQIEMSGLSIRETMALHLEQVEALMTGLGNRSSRHIMSRADLLILELMMHLAEQKKTR